MFLRSSGVHISPWQAFSNTKTTREEEEEGQEEEDMLLGKRPRPPIMRRTTSMSGGMAVESPTTDEELVSDNTHHDHHPNIKIDPLLEAKGSPYEEYGPRLMGMGTVIPFSPTTSNNPRYSHNHTNNTSHFLRTCGLCKCRLAPDRRDIYMYRYVYLYILGFSSLTLLLHT